MPLKSYLSTPSHQDEFPTGKFSRVMGLLFLGALSFLFAFPFVWMFFACFKTNFEIFTPFPLLPQNFQLTYFNELLNGTWIPYPRQFLNSLLVASAQTLGALILSIPAGYVFAQHSSKVTKLLFLLAMLVILIPRQVMVLPLFVWTHQLGLIDHLLAVILPGMVSGLGVLYFTYTYYRFPKHLLDLARVEGASEFRTFLSTLPLIKPTIITYSLIHFILAWHEHIIPLVMLSSPQNLTVSIALTSLGAGSLRIPYGLLMVGSLFTVVPTLLLYILFRKSFYSALKQLTSQ